MTFWVEDWNMRVLVLLSIVKKQHGFEGRGWEENRGDCLAYVNECYKNIGIIIGQKMIEK